MTTIADAWDRLPADMKALPQWAVAGASKAPQSIDANGKLFNVSVTMPSQWMSYERAVEVALAHEGLETTHVDKSGRTIRQTGLNIGFILHQDDPFACIDLDVKDSTTHPNEPALWTTKEQFDFYWRIVQSFGSYTERSRSGKGLHIWVRGEIGKGFKRDGVEVYSQERFIISTGDGIVAAGVEDRQVMLTNMVTQMRPTKTATTFELEELPEEEDDWLILKRASEAANSDKFLDLWAGKWVNLGFPSQSEADLALMSMFTFYSPSNAQCRRLFRESGLGQREKAVKNDDYLNRTLKQIRQREQREASVDITAVIKSAELVQQMAAAGQQAHNLLPPPLSPEPVTVAPAPALPSATAVTASLLAPVSPELSEVSREGLPFPPGLVGAMAHFIYQNSIRPCKEVAIVGAFGLASGMTGKAWHIPQSGLNQYITLVAQSGVGKEAMHSGISALVAACSEVYPHFSRFVDFNEYASGPALLKAVAAEKSFVNVSGEWGRRLQMLATDQRNAAMQTLRTQMTNLYQKSGPNAISGGIGYSSTENNVESVAGVNYTMIGETTPSTFFEALSSSMMEDGFLSRFLIIEYKGPRPPRNRHPVAKPSEALITALTNLASYAHSNIERGLSIPVQHTDQVAMMLDEYEDLCDHHINSTQDEAKRQMWNRAALKAYRLAATMASCDNGYNPVIQTYHYEWARLAVNMNIDMMNERLASGDVGISDGSRERKIISLLSEYLQRPPASSYRVSEVLRGQGIVTRAYLQIRTRQYAAFSAHRMGENRALDETLQGMVGAGYLMEVDKTKLATDYNYHGRAYRILELPSV